MVASFPAVGAASHLPPEERRDRVRREALRDAGIVRRFNAGDPAAFTEIVTRYRAKIQQVALGLLRNHADAEEIAQETFVRAYRSLARFRGESSLATWLHRIVVNLSCNRYRHSLRRQHHRMLPLDGLSGVNHTATFADMLASPAPDPVHVAVNREFSGLAAAALERLEAGQREILLLRNTRHLAYREIAGALGIRIGTVKSRLARARKCLRALLARSYVPVPGSSRPLPANPWFEPRQTGGLLVDA